MFKKGCIPWNKNLTKETDERVRKISEKLKCLPGKNKGKKYNSPSDETREKISKALTGIRRSEKTKRKMSESRLKRKETLGYINSKETRQRISKSSMGKTVWNDGLTKETDERVAKFSHPRSDEDKQKISKANKGKSSWSKGLTKETDERVKKTSEKNKGKIRSEEHKRNYRESALIRIQTQHGPYKDTEPELIMKKYLTESNIPFEHQFRLGNHLFDFYILGTKILIEVDGDYYHGNPLKFQKLSDFQQRQKEKDLKNEQLAKDKGFILLRFWQSDIVNNKEKIKWELRKYLC